MGVGDKIREIRIKKGISQQLLADNSGLSKTAIYYIENGQRSPSQATIRAVAESLQVPVTWLLEQNQQQKEPAQMSRQELINDIDRKLILLPDDLKRQALAYIAGRLAERQSK